MQFRQLCAPPLKFKLKPLRFIWNTFINFNFHFSFFCSCAYHKRPIKQRSILVCSTLTSPPFLLYYLVANTCSYSRSVPVTSISTVLIVIKILLFKRKWQTGVRECEGSFNFSKAGVCRDRMQLGNTRGWSICILQPVLLANAGINEF